MRTTRVPLPLDSSTVSTQEGLAARIGKPVVIGVRPEDIMDRRDANGLGEMGAMPTTVDVVEPLGSEVLLYLDYGTDTPMVVRAEPRSPAKRGDKMEVVFKPEHLHLFDAETELSVL